MEDARRSSKVGCACVARTAGSLREGGHQRTKNGRNVTPVASPTVSGSLVHRPSDRAPSLFGLRQSLTWYLTRYYPPTRTTTT